LIETWGKLLRKEDNETIAFEMVSETSKPPHPIMCLIIGAPLSPLLEERGISDSANSNVKWGEVE
jgi:hypothetical protein